MGRTRDVVASRVFEAVAHLVSVREAKRPRVYTHIYAHSASLGNVQLYVYAVCVRHNDDGRNFHRRLITVMGRNHVRSGEKKKAKRQKENVGKRGDTAEREERGPRNNKTSHVAIPPLRSLLSFSFLSRSLILPLTSTNNVETRTRE